MTKETLPYTAIKEWSPSDRPREKLISKGKEALSDAELIAILLRSGTQTTSAVDLAKNMLHSVGNNLHALARLSVKDFMQIRGMGEAKTLSIIAALELGRRRSSREMVKKPKINSSHDVYEIMKPNLMDLPHEELWILLLNRSHNLISKHRISQGGVANTTGDPKIIFKLALEELACAIVLAHNHPSDKLSPSQADIVLTKRIKEGGKLLDIQVLDHIIIAGQGYFSFIDEGIF